MNFLIFKNYMITFYNTCKLYALVFFDCQESSTSKKIMLLLILFLCISSPIDIDWCIVLSNNTLFVDCSWEIVKVTSSFFRADPTVHK